ncbi:protein NRT1/ PTR FAMILY 4.2-like [Senna tora]|uniref:Protein NRT1/ PTR FAMILY 4.2-like n=1 Tax=Senna tora TaxID=362788 RepID=A0A834TGV0_9FABA|nr:protein NRT1/ PTR FAMILY 4.2-like [Senna tora]
MNYKGRKADPRKHGGIRATSFICVVEVEVLENMVFLSIATNMVSYFVKSLHYSAAKSSNMGLILLIYHSQLSNESKSSEAAILYSGLYAIAIGVGGIKASLPAHGADQLDPTNHDINVTK